ncbi:MAG: phosphate ABC transporter substrate-binding/OmpA family protein [Defluviitaleaceae bacterium]|nr:phosphate ABC transporter substrate-binding/OmpA family protein [Defluviitaleaceae bacterium]
MRALHRLTPLAKCLIVGVTVCCVAGGLYFAGLFDDILPGSNGSETNVTSSVSGEQSSTSTATGTGSAPIQAPADRTIRISLDEWVGWKNLLDANGGLRTQPGSIYYNLGLDIEFVIINDADHSSSALIAGSIDGAGYTINRYAFLFDQFVENGLNPVYIGTLYASTGGDGVIAREQFASIESLYGQRIGVARFSEAMALMDWLIAQSSLTNEQKATMRNDLVMFDSPDDAARAFFAGHLEAAVTWQPYLSQAQEAPGTHLLFCTTHATNLITGGLVFDYGFVQANEDLLVNLMQGAIDAKDMYLVELSVIRASMPMFSLESDASIIEMAGDATLLTARDMRDSIQGIDQLLFAEMADIWAYRGEQANRANADIAFTNRIVNRLELEQIDVLAQPVGPAFTEEERGQVRDQAEQGHRIASLLTMRADIRFEPNTAVILQDGSFSAIESFVDTATLINGSIILIEGNVANIAGDADNTPFAVQLSYERAREVARQMQLRGIDPNRMVIAGNGIENQIASNDTEDGRILNRRTDVSFIIME